MSNSSRSRSRSLSSSPSAITLALFGETNNIILGEGKDKGKEKGGGKDKGLDKGEGNGGGKGEGLDKGKSKGKGKGKGKPVRRKGKGAAYAIVADDDIESDSDDDPPIGIHIRLRDQTGGVRILLPRGLTVREVLFEHLVMFDSTDRSEDDILADINANLTGCAENGFQYDLNDFVADVVDPGGLLRIVNIHGP